MCHRLQMSNDAIQETDNREETGRRTRQVKQDKRRIQQKPGRSRRNGRHHNRQKDKENNQSSNTSKSDTQRKRLEIMRQEELGVE